MAEIDSLFTRAEGLIERLERLLPPVPQRPDLNAAVAFRWRRSGRAGWLEPVHHRADIRLADLRCIDRQRDRICLNTRQFLAGLPANNVLLWGPRGTGKSSLIKAVLNEYAGEGLRLLEVDRQHLLDLPDIVEPLYDRSERYIIFCDDLSFEADDASYKALKVVLDGSIHRAPANSLVYATSNRRHLLPERLAENLEARNVDGEIHHGEAVEEKISLSERFGLWLAFHPFSQDDYLGIVAHWLHRLGVREDGEAMRREALTWALLHGSRSGRSAWQFAKDWVGRKGLRDCEA
ncbi:MAG: ATP-binding protein [Gammaproteobacteria bacterium]|nr:ATP-binding protein [Gammaproteobacteria bacterium]